MTYPAPVVEQAQILRLAGYSFPDIQKQLQHDPTPDLHTLWRWCHGAEGNETLRIKAREFVERLASMSLTLKEIKLQHALEHPETISHLETNAYAGTDVDKLIAFQRLDQDRTVNTALEFAAQVAERARQLQLEHDKHPDALWSLAAPREAARD